jgi:hypothetical protein
MRVYTVPLQESVFWSLTIPGVCSCVTCSPAQHVACFISSQASGEASGLQETDTVAEILEAVTYTQAPVSTGTAPCGWVPCLV